jgi:hypothetical protein
MKPDNQTVRPKDLVATPVFELSPHAYRYSYKESIYEYLFLAKYDNPET